MKTAIALIAALAATPVMAKVKWSSQDQFNAITQVANAYALASFCNNVAVNVDGTAKFLEQHSGAGYTFNAEQVAGFGLMVVGLRELQKLDGKPGSAEFCADALKWFGPNGTKVRDLLE
ncbi:MAG: hypothetical protein ACLQFI_14195 [Methylocella sp.]